MTRGRGHIRQTLASPWACQPVAPPSRHPSRESTTTVTMAGQCVQIGTQEPLQATQHGRVGEGSLGPMAGP